MPARIGRWGLEVGASRAQEFQLGGSQGPWYLLSLRSVLTPSLRPLPEELENKAGRGGRGVRGAAINRERSRERGGGGGEGENGQRGLPGQGPKGGRRRGQGPPGVLTLG